MKTEISATLDYLFEQLDQVGTSPALMGLTSVQKADLRISLEATLEERFTGHWYPLKPLKGSAFRCLQITPDDRYVHPILLEAFASVGITGYDLLQGFSQGLSIWTDPNEVSCQLGTGAIFPVYKMVSAPATAPTWQPSSPQQHIQQQHRKVRPNSTPPTATSSVSTYQDGRSNTPPGLSSSSSAPHTPIKMPITDFSSLNPNAKVFMSPSPQQRQLHQMQSQISSPNRGSPLFPSNDHLQSFMNDDRMFHTPPPPHLQQPPPHMMPPPPEEFFQQLLSDDNQQHHHHNSFHMHESQQQHAPFSNNNYHDYQSPMQQHQGPPPMPSYSPWKKQPEMTAHNGHWQSQQQQQSQQPTQWQQDDLHSRFNWDNWERPSH